MSDPQGWKWTGRAADVAQLAPILFALGLIVIAILKSDNVADAVGGEPVLVTALAVLAVVGLALLVTGFVRRHGFARTFQGDRGRGDTVMLVTGCVFVAIAVALLLLAF